MNNENNKKLVHEIVNELNVNSNNSFSNEIEWSTKSNNSSQNSDQKLIKDQIFIDDIIFWNSKKKYLKLLKKVDGETFCSEFFHYG